VFFDPDDFFLMMMHGACGPETFRQADRRYTPYSYYYPISIFLKFEKSIILHHHFQFNINENILWNGPYIYAYSKM